MSFYSPCLIFLSLIAGSMSTGIYANTIDTQALSRTQVTALASTPMTGAGHSIPASRFFYTHPPVIVVPSPPPFYLDQNEGDRQANHWWYYCHSAQAYYPYVKACPYGWQLVAPRSPD